MRLINIIKYNKTKLVKISLLLSVFIIVFQGVVKFILGIDYFDLNVSQQLSTFFLFKIKFIQVIISQFFLMLNYCLIIGIANNFSIKQIIYTSWYLLLFTYVGTLLPKEYEFILCNFILLGINICTIINIKGFKWSFIFKSFIKLVIVSVLFFIYQPITLWIKFGEIPTISSQFSFYEEMIYSLDMYIMGLCFYFLRKEVFEWCSIKKKLIMSVARKIKNRMKTFFHYGGLEG